MIAKKKILSETKPVGKPRAMLLRLIDDSMLVIPDSEIHELRSISFEARNDTCQVNNYKTKESMDKIIERLGWEVSTPGEENK
jgi:hypothetical protein